MKRNLNFILILFLLAPIGVSAFQYAPEWKVKEPNKIVRFFSKIRECKLRISCYRSLGAFTEITSATAINSFPTIYNNNLAITLETGTTSVASITTLSGLTTANALTSASSLATVGTITSGTWNGSTLTVAYGGTGSTTLSANQVLLGNGTGNISVVAGLGSNGQFLTSGGAGTPPTWTTGSFDTTSDRVITGLWSFTNGVTTTASTTINRLFSRFATTTEATTTNLTVTGHASTSLLTTSLNCTSCPGAYTGSSTVFAVSSGAVTHTGAIPGNSTYALVQYSISGGNLQGTLNIARSGLTSVTLYFANAGSDDQYGLAWSGNNMTVTEDTDVGANSTFNGTFYWYR